MIEYITPTLLLLKVSACVAIFLRLYLYPWPGEARYRLGVTCAAYFLMFCSGGEALSILLGSRVAASPFEVAMFWGIYALIYMAGGNLARILQLSETVYLDRRRYDYGRDGTDRRHHTEGG